MEFFSSINSLNTSKQIEVNVKIINLELFLGGLQIFTFNAWVERGDFKPLMCLV